MKARFTFLVVLFFLTTSIYALGKEHYRSTKGIRQSQNSASQANVAQTNEMDMSKQDMHLRLHLTVRESVLTVVISNQIQSTI